MKRLFKSIKKRQFNKYRITNNFLTTLQKEGNLIWESAHKIQFSVSDLKKKGETLGKNLKANIR